MNKEIYNADNVFTEEWYESRFDLKTKVGEYIVSTVELGINHGFLGKDLWYETMIFKDNDFSGEFGYQERYEREEEAREGHEKAVKWLKEKLKDGR